MNSTEPDPFLSQTSTFIATISNRRYQYEEASIAIIKCISYYNEIDWTQGITFRLSVANDFINAKVGIRRLRAEIGWFLSENKSFSNEFFDDLLEIEEIYKAAMEVEDDSSGKEGKLAEVKRCFLRLQKKANSWWKYMNSKLEKFQKKLHSFQESFTSTGHPKVEGHLVKSQEIELALKPLFGNISSLSLDLQVKLFEVMIYAKDIEPELKAERLRFLFKGSSITKTAIYLALAKFNHVIFSRKKSDTASHNYKMREAAAATFEILNDSTSGKITFALTPFENGTIEQKMVIHIVLRITKITLEDGCERMPESIVTALAYPNLFN